MSELRFCVQNSWRHACKQNVPCSASIYRIESLCVVLPEKEKCSLFRVSIRRVNGPEEVSCFLQSTISALLTLFSTKAKQQVQQERQMPTSSPRDDLLNSVIPPLSVCVSLSVAALPRRHIGALQQRTLSEQHGGYGKSFFASCI